MNPITHCLILLILSSLFVPIYAHWAKRKHVVDIPNARSSHEVITPRGGGIVFVGLWLVWLLMQYRQLPVWIVLGLTPSVCLLMLLGFWDDLCDLSASKRLVGQMLAAASFLGILVLYSNRSLHFFGLPTWISLVLAFLALVWSTNLFNFMDGTDGIASMEALWIFLPGSLVLYHYHASPLVSVVLALSACISGFLIWNWPKAKIFMGDVGSSTLGFVIVATVIMAHHIYECPIWYWFALYGVFWFDATVTLCRRALNKQPIWQAHRLHAYQRLHQSGVSHLGVLKWLAVVNMILTTVVLLTIYCSFLSHATMSIVVLCLMTLCYRRIEHLRPFMC